jgi:glycosyltransferase involved in cell wall biosynthesis
MLNSKTVAVVIPAFNEETQIIAVIDSIPDFVDKIIIVNDGSADKTEEIVVNYIKTAPKGLKVKKRENVFGESNFYNAERAYAKLLELEDEGLPKANILNENPEEDRVILMSFEKNQGVGSAVSRGYKWCKDYELDCVAKIDGDGQMDPNELYDICKPVAFDGVDYVKGNRLKHKSAWLVIPKIRFFGNSILSMLTKIASGYWRISDTQTAFTAISKNGLESLALHKIYRSYGYPNDVLVKLNIASCTLTEVEIKPIYDIGESSKMKIFKVIPKMSFLLFRSFFKRLWTKYLFKDFHPLFVLYHLSFFLFFACIPFGVKMVYLQITGIRIINEATILAFMFLAINAIMTFLFAMWMDIQDNDRLYK